MIRGKRFQSVVMAGGGSRCFWHAGFWREAAGPLGLAPVQFATVSASAAIGSTIVAGVAEDALRAMQRLVRRNPKNVYLGNLLGGEPVFPHVRIYSAAVLEVVDSQALARLHAGPDVRVLLGRIPWWLGARTGAIAALAAYNLDKRIRRKVHPVLPQRLGFRPEVVPVRACSTPRRLMDLILASSCTPPMTPLLEWDGRRALDGGVVDNVPVCALADEPGETLVLLTRRYRSLPAVPGRTYVQPSEPVGIGAWDYTSADGLQRAYDLGRRDGEGFVLNQRVA